jgi:hypothetical protein
MSIDFCATSICGSLASSPSSWTARDGPDRSHHERAAKRAAHLDARCYDGAAAVAREVSMRLESLEASRLRIAAFVLIGHVGVLGCGPSAGSEADGSQTEGTTAQTAETGDEAEGTSAPSTGDTEESDTTTDGGDTEAEELCPPREITDSVTFGWSGSEYEVLDCMVLSVEVSADPLEYEVSLRCAAEGEPLSRMFTFRPGGLELMGPFPIVEQQMVELHTWNDDFPPFWNSFLLRDASEGALLFAFIDSPNALPLDGDETFMAPLSAGMVEGVCPDEGDVRRRAIRVAHEDEGTEVVIIDGHRDVLATESAGPFEVRVRRAVRILDDSDGGCTSCVEYTVLALE